MPATQQFRTPIPIFIPALSVALVLTVLFLLGLKEQQKLIDERVAQILRQLETTAHMVVDSMNMAVQDLPLDQLLHPTQRLHQVSGSYFVLVAADQRVVASDRHADALLHGDDAVLPQLQDDLLAQALASASGEDFQRLHLDGHAIFIARIKSRDWRLLNVVPLQPIAQQVNASFATIRNITLTALVAELLIAIVILAWSHYRARRQYNHLAAMQEQLIRSEHHFRTLVNNIPGIVYRCRNDSDWSMLYVSDTVERFTGYPAADFIGERCRSITTSIHPDDRRDVEAAVESSLELNRPFVLEYRIVHKSGDVHWMLEHGCHARHDFNPNGELEGVILDITALKQAEASLRELNDSLEQQVEVRTAELRNAIRDLETFNYAVSHDLKAPVRQVTGFLEAIADELPNGSSDELRDMIRRSHNALLRMKEMIASLHTFSQLKKESLTLEPVNVNNLLNGVIRHFPEPTHQRIKWVTPALNSVVADHALLRIVLQHLLDNAIKFSAHAERPQIRVADHSTSAEWILEVHDNGVGFNPDYRDRMFQMFQRLHTQEAFPGFGVGLALAQKILSLHGGRIWADSEPGKGASFFIAIPLKVVRSPPLKAAHETT